MTLAPKGSPVAIEPFGYHQDEVFRLTRVLCCLGHRYEKTIVGDNEEHRILIFFKQCVVVHTVEGLAEIDQQGPDGMTLI